jgi:hypothetical protein
MAQQVRKLYYQLLDEDHPSQLALVLASIAVDRASHPVTGNRPGFLRPDDDPLDDGDSPVGLEPGTGGSSVTGAIVMDVLGAVLGGAVGYGVAGPWGILLGALLGGVIGSLMVLA